MSDNAQPVGDNAKFEEIEKMPIVKTSGSLVLNEGFFLSLHC